MFNLPDDIIDLIMEYKTEEEQKDNKNKMIKELKGVISYAKYNLNEFDFDDHINTNKFTNEILYVYEDYKNIY